MNRFIYFSILIILSSYLFSQEVQEVWIHSEFDESGIKIELDNTNNVYVLTQNFSIYKYSNNGDIIWSNQYASPIEAVDFKIDEFNNIYIVGLKLRESSFVVDMVTIAYNSEGIQLWENIHAIAECGSIIEPLGLLIDNSGNTFVTGFESYSSPNGLGMGATFLIKYNTLGEIEWLTHYNSIVDNCSKPNDIIIDSSGNIFIIGSDGVWGESVYQTFIIKYNSDGQLLWQNSHDIYQTEWSQDQASLTIQEDYIYGASINYGEFGKEIIILKYSLMGDLLWSSISDVNTANRIYCSADSNNDLIILSDGNSLNHLLKIDENGNELWVNNIDMDPRNFTIDQNGFIYVTGRVNNDISTSKLDTNGNQEWSINYNGPENLSDYSSSIILDGSNSFYVTGYSETTNNSYSCVTIKYSELSSEFANILPIKSNRIYIYPNPFNPSTTIIFEIDKPGYIDVNIYNIKGQQIRQLLNSNVQKGLHNVIWNGKNESGTTVSSGQYFVNLKQNGNSVTTKILLQK